MNCRICVRPLPAGGDRYACQRCEYETRATLEQLLAALPMLRAGLVPGSAVGGRRPVGRAHSPLPAALPVLDLLGPGTVTYAVADADGEQSADVPLTPLIISWCQHLARDYPAVGRRGGTEYRQQCEAAYVRRTGDLPAWITWLHRYIPYAVTRPWIRDLRDALEEALARVRQVTGTVARTHLRLAPCPRCEAFGLARTDGEWEVVCQVCEHRMEPDAYAAHAAAVLPSLTAIALRMTAAELAQGTA